MSFVHREHTEASGIVGALAALAKRFAVKLREKGPAFLILRIIHRITPDKLFTVSDLIVVASEIPAAAASVSPDPELRWATGSDRDIIAATVPRAKLYFERFPHTGRIAAVMGENDVVALEWFVTPPDDGGSSWEFPMLEGGGWLCFRLPREDIWSIWSWVDPGHRGKRLMVRCQSFANIQLAAEKYARSWGAIYSGNERAIRAHSKRAYRPVSRIAYARVLGLTFLRVDGALRIGRWTSNRPYNIDARALIDREDAGAEKSADAVA